MAEPLTQEGLIAALKETFGGGNKGAAGKAGASSAASGAADNLVGKFVSIAKEATPVITGFAGIGTQGKIATDALSKLAHSVPGVGGALGGLVDSIAKSRETINEVGKQGIGANNFAKLQADTAGAGQTIQQHAAMLKNAGGTLNSLGGTANVVSQRMNLLNTEIQQTPIPRTLKEAGVGREEIAQAGALMAANTKLNLADGESRKQLVGAAGELAMEIKKTSDMTGLSRDAIQQELEERLKSADSQLAMQTMNEQQRQQYIKTQASLVGMGPSINSLADKIASGARLSPEDRDKMNALGPAAADFQRAIRMQQMATNDAQKQQAATALEAAKAKVNEWQNSDRYARLALQGGSSVSAQMKNMAVENRQRQGMAAQQRETGGTAVQAQRERERQVTEITKGRVATGPQAGKTDAGQTLNRTFNTAVERAAVNSAGAARNLDDLNNKLGQNQKIVGALNKVIDTTLGTAKTQQEAADRNAASIKKGAESLGATTPKTAVPTSKLGAPGERLERRDTGTSGKLSSVAEPKDIIASIEKGERVLNPKENADLNKVFEKIGAMAPPTTKMDDIAKITSKQPSTESIQKQIDEATAKASAKSSPTAEKAKLPEFKIPSLEEMFSKFKASISSTAPADVKKTEKSAVSPITVAEKSKTTEEKPKAPVIEATPKPKITSPEVPSISEIADKIKAPAAPAIPSISEIAEATKPKETKLTEEEATKKPDVADTQIEKPATLNDVLTAINVLNKTMGQMVSHTESISEASSKTARLAGKATGNRALA